MDGMDLFNELKMFCRALYEKQISVERFDILNMACN